MGLLGYDLLSPPSTHEEIPALPSLLMGDYRAFIHVDHRRQLAELVMLAGHSGAKDDWLDLLAKAMHPPPKTGFTLTKAFQPLTSRERYRNDVSRILDYLRAGDCYQVNYAQAFHARCSGSGAAAMERLLALSQPVHAAWMCWPEGEVLSLSPELFLSVKDRHIITRPIKGTAPRHPDPVTDRQNLATLQASSKNQAENLMIVDLLRNDLGQHAETGSVEVSQLFSPESLPQVHHLVSTVTATLLQGSNVLDLIQDCFPGGSVTGAPKRRAMEIIAELEPTPRTVYCGSIGYINHDGDAELNIAIRTLLRVGDDLYAWAGGGIVADSDWEAEYQECFDKMGAIMRALEDGGRQ
ncbi:MAG: aminodeoxychorismate synthase component I [Moraxellaceae bacterium]|nr:aminodeoxychorismate synthase component I [Moraxellaceae bacterium]